MPGNIANLGQQAEEAGFLNHLGQCMLCKYICPADDLDSHLNVSHGDAIQQSFRDPEVFRRWKEAMGIPIAPSSKVVELQRSISRVFKQHDPASEGLLSAQSPVSAISRNGFRVLSQEDHEHSQHFAETEHNSDTRAVPRFKGYHFDTFGDLIRRELYNPVSRRPGQSKDFLMKSNAGVFHSSCPSGYHTMTVSTTTVSIDQYLLIQPVVDV